MYGEIIIGVNMLFNYAILSFANKVGNIQAARGRLLFASFAGALPVAIFPSSAIVVVLSFMCMTVCAFGKAFESWDVHNSAGENVASGTYIWITQAGDQKKTGKVMVIR